MALNEFSERLVAKEQQQDHECAVNACTHILTRSSLALTGLLALPAPGGRSSHNGNGRILAYRMPVLQGVLHTGSPAIGGTGDITRNWQAWHSPHGWGTGVAVRVLHSLMEMHMWCSSLCIDASFGCRRKYLSGPMRLQKKEWEKTFFSPLASVVKRLHLYASSLHGFLPHLSHLAQFPVRTDTKWHHVSLLHTEVSALNWPRMSFSPKNSTHLKMLVDFAGLKLTLLEVSVFSRRSEQPRGLKGCRSTQIWVSFSLEERDMWPKPETWSWKNLRRRTFSTCVFHFEKKKIAV